MGASGLVQELSSKLARQRKLLDELIAQKAATASTVRRWHVGLGVLLNNLLSMMIVSKP